MRARGVPYLLQVLGVGLAYVAGARLGQFTALPPGNVSALWAPAGIAVAAVALAGFRVWPGIWLGAFAYNFSFYHGGGTTDPSVAMGVSVGIATGSTLMAVVGCHLVRLVQGPIPAVDSPRDALLWTLGAGFLAATISASIGTAILSGADLLPLQAPIVWRTWWLGDATGVVLIAPVAVLWDRHGTLRSRPGQETETLLAALAFAVTCFLAFGTTAPRTSAPYLLAAPVLFLSYTALRFGRRITASTALVLAIVAGIATASGKGPLHAAEYPDALFALQAFLATGATLGLTLACAVAESRRGPRTADAPIPPETGAFPIAELVAFRRTSITTIDPVPTLTPAPSTPLARTPGLDAVLAALPEPLYVLTRRSLSVSHCNDAFARALGCAGRPEVEGRSLFDLFPPEVALHAADEARRVFRTGEARASREEWLGGASGPVTFDVSRTPVYDANGAVDGLLARARPSGAR